MADNTIQERKEMEERIKKLEAALEPFANAYDRIRYYDPVEPSDDENLFAGNEASYELFGGKSEPHGVDPDGDALLKVGHLANAAEVLRNG